MATGPQGLKRPADVIGAAVMVGKFAMGEIKESERALTTAAENSKLRQHLTFSYIETMQYQTHVPSGPVRLPRLGIARPDRRALGGAFRVACAATAPT